MRTLARSGVACGVTPSRRSGGTRTLSRTSRSPTLATPLSSRPCTRSSSPCWASWYARNATSPATRRQH
eukprot:5841641-Lingulodinium_polyedra.AAC.1